MGLKVRVGNEMGHGSGFETWVLGSGQFNPNSSCGHPYFWDKTSLQTSFEKNLINLFYIQRNLLNLSYIFLLNVNFENITVGLHVFYILNKHVKFHLNWMFFKIRSIAFFCA